MRKKLLLITLIAVLIGVTIPVYGDELEIVEEVEEGVDEPLLTKEDILNKYSNDLEFNVGDKDDIDKTDYVVIQGNINKQTITVMDIINNINTIELNNYFSNIDILIISDEDIILNNEDLVYEGYYLFIISDNFVARYNITFRYDYNNDSIIDDIDIDYVIENIFKEEDTYKIEDVSNIDYVVNNDSFDIPGNTYTDLVNTDINNYDNVYVGEDVDIEYTIDTKDITDNIVLSGKINYDNSYLELESVNINNVIYKGVNIDNNFLYLIENNNMEIITVVFKFKLLKSGITSVSINNIKLANKGSLLNINSNIESNLIIKEYGIGGDEDITNNGDTPENTPVIDNSPIINIPTNTNNNINNTYLTNTYIPTNNVVATTITLSNDTSIKELDIEGYEIDFDSNIYEYEITVPNDINYLNFNVIPSSDRASFYINGNENFATGRNEVIITIQAEDGSTRDYTIVINKEENISEEVNNNEPEEEINIFERVFYIVIPIIIIILIIVDIVYIRRHKER